MHDIHYIVLVFFVSLLVSSLTHHPMLRLARKYGIYDNPESRKLQRVPIPVMGGCVVFLGAAAGSLCYWHFHDCTSIIPVQAAMTVMLLIGILDDMRDLSPYLKFAIETVVVTLLALYSGLLIDDLHGLWGIHQLPLWVAWPFTVIACVGIINSINLIDGVDGLSSGMCILILTFYSSMFFFCHDYVRAAFGSCFVGALIPFFVLNVFGEKSKMFIGDAGTLMLGVVISDMVAAMTSSASPCARQLDASPYCAPAFALAVMAVPVFDTLRVMFGRILRGRSPFRPDRSHLHHAFICYGFHHLDTALLEIFLDLAIVMLWYATAHSYLPREWQFYIVAAVGIAAICVLYWMLGRKKRIARRTTP